MHISFIDHARERLQKRKILVEEVMDAIKTPDLVNKRHGKYYYQKKLPRGTIEVVCESTESHIKVITVYWV